MTERTCSCGAVITDGRRRRCVVCAGPPPPRYAVRSDEPGVGTSRMTCLRCGTLLTGKQRFYCSLACDEITRGARRAEPLPDCDCPVCGARFSPVRANQRFCRRRCARRWANHFQRLRENGSTIDLTAPLTVEFDCAECGVRCVPGGNVAAHATKFCGRRCKARWHRAPVGDRGRRGERRRAAARRRLVRAAAGSTAGRRWTEGPCAECGDRFVGRRGARFCRAVCKRRAVNRRRARKYGRKFRTRARRHGVEYEPITPRLIFERDGYRCGICGGFTDRGALVPDPRAPTLDHIVPMSRGGPHVRGNVQCACFECNWRKGAL